MKTTLAVLTFVSVLAGVAGFAAELTGATVPHFLEPSATFGSFAITAILLMCCSDYSRRRHLSMAPRRIQNLPAVAKAAHPLAA